MASYDLDQSGNRKNKSNSDMFQTLSLFVSEDVGKCSH